MTRIQFSGLRFSGGGGADGVLVVQTLSQPGLLHGFLRDSSETPNAHVSILLELLSFPVLFCMQQVRIRSSRGECVNDDRDFPFPFYRSRC